jgi:hypothetical protein
MKRKINFTAMMSVGVTILIVLGGAGCSSSGNQAWNRHDAAFLTAGTRYYSQPSSGFHQRGGFPRTSVVSPLGDAPGENDLAWTSGMSAEIQEDKMDVMQAGLVR